uniref:Mycbp-associated protein n=1 Tax=Tetraselmis sp. GSL018 TaxID=582737 RepID=A0A061SIY6_9CHLO
MLGGRRSALRIRARAPCTTLARAGGTYGDKRFYLSDQYGVILPGQVKDFVFTFKSDQPGIYESYWSIATHPELPQDAKQVTLRGVATLRDAKKLKRHKLQARISSREKDEQVSVSVERILRGVATPPRLEQPLSEEEEAQACLFDAKNMGSSPAVYYNPSSFAEMQALYIDAWGVLHAEPLAEEALPKDKEPQRGKDKDPSIEEDPFSSEEWSGNVSQLQQIVAAAVARDDADPEEAARLQARLIPLLEAVKIPPNRRAIVVLPSEKLAAPPWRKLLQGKRHGWQKCHLMSHSLLFQNREPRDIKRNRSQKSTTRKSS